MKMKTTLFTIFSLLSLLIFGQVGIGLPANQTPTETLEVNGVFQLHDGNELFLENAGPYMGTSGNSIMMVHNTDTNTLNKFDPSSMPFAAITFIPYHFDNVSAHGLHNYDTKIDASKFYITIGGFFVLKEDGNTSIEMTGSDSHFPLYSARAFVQNGTWRLKFDLNNNRQFDHLVDIYLNVSVYYNNFLTKTNTVKSVNMNGNTSGSTSKPDGAIE